MLRLNSILNSLIIQCDGCAYLNSFFSSTYITIMYKNGSIGIGPMNRLKNDCEVILVAKTIDGVYTDDPNVNKDAKKLENIDYDEIIKHDLKVMDRSACDLCQQNNIPIIVFDFKAKDAIKKVILGEKIGTYVGRQ